MLRGIASAVTDFPLPTVADLATREAGPDKAFRVLVSTMISLRTRDAVTNVAGRRLFSLATTPQQLAALPEERIARAIYPAGFYRTKARSLRSAARLLVDRFHGNVPASLEQLLQLPGVGRKTANLVVTLGFDLPGICVDTHVHRICNRLGWVATRDADRTELSLRAALPRRYWIPLNGWLVAFGQRVCTPRRPRCEQCPIASLCPRIGVGGS